jgi:hypothetical protein
MLFRPRHGLGPFCFRTLGICPGIAARDSGLANTAPESQDRTLAVFSTRDIYVLSQDVSFTTGWRYCRYYFHS